MKQWKKLLGIFMSGVVLITGGVLSQSNGDIAKGATDYGISNPRIENGVTTWDKIKFGSYYQDIDEVQPEPIKWRVLSVNGDDAFLLADEILDCKPYNEKLEDVTWGTCTLREWLNNDFYNEAFDDEEKKAVKETTVVNENNPYYDAEGGNDTKDKVYLLSIAEVGNAAYGFDGSETRKAKTTDYMKINDAGSNSNGFGDWILRSPGGEPKSVAYVNYDGYSRDYLVSLVKFGVRPALHINISSSKVEDAGEVDSEGNVTMLGNGISNPVVKDGVTIWDCVYFGNYRQNCSFKKQDIEWRVLSVDGDDAFLLADEILDCKQYNAEDEDVTWETCTLREWLNNDFYNEAFDDEEKKAVKETTVVNENNPYHDTEGGNDTKDKVYLLSITEVGNAAYGFDEFHPEIEEGSKTRRAKTTDYAKVNDVYSNRNGLGSWWLRSPGYYNIYLIDSIRAATVHCYGYGQDMGYYVNDGQTGVRPALHINLSSSLWSKGGEVRSDEQGDDSPTASPTSVASPTKEPEVTEKPTATVEPTNTPSEINKPIASLEPTKEPALIDNPTTPTGPTQIPTATEQPTLSAVTTQNPTPTAQPVLKQIKLLYVKCARNAKKVTGKVSVSKVSIKIKVSKKAYKKATVKGKKFTLKLNYKLKKKTKIKIMAEKKGYKSIVRTYTVK